MYTVSSMPIDIVSVCTAKIPPTDDELEKSVRKNKMPSPRLLFTSLCIGWLLFNDHDYFKGIHSQIQGDPLPVNTQVPLLTHPRVFRNQ